MAEQDNGNAPNESRVPRERITDDLDEFRDEPIGGDAEFDRSLSAWVDEKNHESLPATVTLYKFRNPLSGTDKEQCNQWKNEIPDTHTIGIKFGSGRYLMIVNIPPGKKQRKLTTSRLFTLGAYYDELKRAEQGRAFLAGPGGGATIPRPLAVQAVAAPVDASLAIMERLLQMLAPILQAALQPKPSPGAEIVQAYQGLNHILREQAMENAGLISDMARKNAGMALEYDGEGVEPLEPAKPSVLETLIPFIAQIAEKILGGGPQGAAAAGMVKTIPGFKQVMSNPQEVKGIIAYLDKQYGVDKTNIMLQKLKIKRPA